METTAKNLLQLAQELNLSAHGVAMAVDNHMMPRASWSDTILKEHAQIVIIKAACGG